MTIGPSCAATSTLGRFPWLVILFGVVGFATLLALGTWQVQRLQWKQGLVATIDARTHSAPVPLAEIESLYRSTGDVDYMLRVAVGSMSEYDDFYRRLIAEVPLKNVTSRFAMERVKSTTAYPLQRQIESG